MTTIRNEVADRYVQNPPGDMKFFLLHGSDEGLVHERAKAIVAAILGNDPEPFNLTRMDGDALSREPGRIADEAYAISMFGGRRALWVDAGSRDLTVQIEALLRRPPEQAVVVVEAGNLKRGAPLRALFESADNAASIECQRDDRRSIAGVIDAETAAAGVRISPEARESLLSLLGADRQTTRGEVHKLILYAMGGGKIELADVEAIVTDAAPSRLDGLIDLALQGNLAEVESAAGRHFGEDGDAALALIRLVSRISLIHAIALGTEQRRSIAGASQFILQRLPPSERASLTRQAERWGSAAMAKRLPAVLGVIARARRDGRLSQAIVTRALWALASGARAPRP